jgi:hypothetical protein
VSQPLLPHNRNLDPRFGRSSGSTGIANNWTFPHYGKTKTWMARMKKVLAFPCCFFLNVVAPLYLEELDHFTPRDTILQIQDFDGVLRL